MMQFPGRFQRSNQYSPGPRPMGLADMFGKGPLSSMPIYGGRAPNMSMAGLPMANNGLSFNPSASPSQLGVLGLGMMEDADSGEQGALYAAQQLQAQNLQEHARRQAYLESLMRR